MNAKFEHISADLEALAGRIPPLVLAEVGEGLKKGDSIPLKMSVNICKDWDGQVISKIQFSIGSYCDRDEVEGENFAEVMVEYLRRKGWKEEHQPMPQMLALSRPKGGEDVTEI